MTPILVPRRGDGGWRDRCWEYVRAWWTRLAIGPIHEGDGGSPFNRAAARNAAARLAGDWDVAVFADADTIMFDPTPLALAISAAATSGKVILPHDQYVALTPRGTSRLLYGHAWQDYVKVRREAAPLGIVVVPRSAWDTLHGFDERFTGWGGEDVAFRIAAQALSGLVRLPGTIVHLWHPVDATKRVYIRTRGGPLRQRYREAAGDPRAIEALIRERAA